MLKDEYLDQICCELIYESFLKLKNDMSRELLNSELSILYKERIYGNELKLRQEKYSILAAEIDDILNNQMEVLMNKIEDKLGDKENVQNTVLAK